MKMEKINDYQIRFMLSNQDLKERNITFEDLFQRSDKLQGLVREIMKKASETIDFNVNESPVMVEAHPMPEGISLIVSKTPDKNDKTLDHPKKQFSNFYSEFLDRSFSRIRNNAEHENNDILVSEFSAFIYSFDSLADVITACSISAADFHSISTLYKMNDTYYLVLKGGSRISPTARNCFMEYGELCPPQNGMLGMLTEYGKVIIKDNAVHSLAQCK